MTERRVSFGYWLRRRRKALDLTQAELATRAGCVLTTIKKIETGTRQPSCQLIERLATALALSDEERALLLDMVGALSPPELPPFSAPPNTARTLSLSALLLPSMLPAPSGPLIGRAPEVVALCALLLGPEMRLVTLTGPGGFGETRLALQIATDLRDAFVNGVRFSNLAPFSDLAPGRAALARASR